MARLFYNRPKYAILDECTSSVTLETEKVMYEHAKALGITLMTVSHRRSLAIPLQDPTVRWPGEVRVYELDAEKRLKLEARRNDWSCSSGRCGDSEED